MPAATSGWKARAPYVSFVELEPVVRKEIERASKERRILLQTLPRFARLLNGLRPNELSIFTGPTGCGKTTVLSQMSLDYATQGVRVLWGSFEIRNARLAQVMLQQLATAPLIDEDTSTLDVSKFQYASERLKMFPITFMNLFGSTGLDTVLDTMEFSMSRDGTRPNLIILDNLQFMLSGQGASSLDRWELMDRAITEIRQFCNRFPTHVVLVVHPRKELDDTPLGLASVSGTAKATQEADNVVILQKLGDRRFLDVRKNRHFGDLGRVQIGFVPECRMVMELVEKDLGAAEAPPTSDAAAEAATMAAPAIERGGDGKAAIREELDEVLEE